MLRSANIQFCDMCVIISSIDRRTTDEHLIDKSAILCSLNIKAMNFADTVGLLSGGPEDLIASLSPNQVLLNKKTMMKDRTCGVYIPMLTELSKQTFIPFRYSTKFEKYLRL